MKNLVDDSLSRLSEISRKYSITMKSLLKILEIDLENSEHLMNSKEQLKEILVPNNFIALLENKGHLLTPSAREKAFQNAKDKNRMLKMKDGGVVFAKLLQSNELGKRPNGKRAGSFLLVPKQVAKGYFGELSMSILNPKKTISIKANESGEVYDYIYDYHNSRIVESRPKGRDEYRMYSGYIKELNPGDILLMIASPNPPVEYITYLINPSNLKYEKVKGLLKKYKSGRSLAALIPILELVDIDITIAEMFESNESLYDYDEEVTDALPVDTSLKSIPEVSSTLSPEALSDLLRQSLQNEGVDRTVTVLKKIKRDSRFRKAVLKAYSYECSVTGLSINYGHTFNVQAAHIKGKEYGGSDNPKNGISFSLDLHWAFDRGFFTINDDYTVKVHEKALDNKILLDIDRKKIILPQNEELKPSLEMIKYHREHVFGRFVK
ncbi:HNH endonuclease [Paraliobacillus zengyii]|uniref:HNH endonuclease n=1 Tax=Paraliobacillus zengyii TaxID=2213194 RepID=UPI0013A701AD|nr:HNH endonuclease [Paraliobacillus zengyii]